MYGLNWRGRRFVPGIAVVAVAVVVFVVVAVVDDVSMSDGGTAKKAHEILERHPDGQRENIMNHVHGVHNPWQIMVGATTYGAVLMIMHAMAL